MSDKRLHCGCMIYSMGFIAKKCKYHSEHCHFLGCKKKLKRGEYEYCRECQEHLDEVSKTLVDAYGGSDY